MAQSHRLPASEIRQKKNRLSQNKPEICSASDLRVCHIRMRLSRYSKIVLTMFLNDLYIFLWTLLFIFPGLVKSYSYRMVPYIITEHPELEPNEAITISRNMMYGHKWDTWILDLSFIGWNILNYMTFGILGIFYVNPYICATDAQIYKILKEDREQGMNIIDSDGEYI